MLKQTVKKSEILSEIILLRLQSTCKFDFVRKKSDQISELCTNFLVISNLRCIYVSKMHSKMKIWKMVFEGIFNWINDMMSFSCEIQPAGYFDVNTK